MPIYEYHCSSCNSNFELKQGFDADTVQPCPDCKSSSQRNFNVPTVIYKGSGFYTTDYARKNTPSANTSSTTTPKTETSSQKTESKTETNTKE
ncbi:MAG: zinc ribbon domain-containing protein [Dehalococcoidia bacterium]|nr:zinc ribbon domain-containing protein [Dehalococcoidia bacterium]